LDGTEHVKESSTIFVVLVKVPSVTLNDVSPHLPPGLKELVGLDLRWDRRFTRSPDPTGAELTEYLVGRCPRQKGASRFRADWIVANNPT
jgi:hypothetical protein